MQLGYIGSGNMGGALARRLMRELFQTSSGSIHCWLSRFRQPIRGVEIACSGPKRRWVASITPGQISSMLTS